MPKISQTLIMIFAHVPEFKVVMPAAAYDDKELMVAAI